MAKLDQILLKTSTESREDLVKLLKGEATSRNSGAQKIQAGEIVLRRESGIVELWSLDLDGEPQQISVDITGMIPPWNPEEIQAADLGMLGDVDLSAGQSLRIDRAGRVGPLDVGTSSSAEGGGP